MVIAARGTHGARWQSLTAGLVTVLLAGQKLLAARGFQPAGRLAVSVARAAGGGVTGVAEVSVTVAGRRAALAAGSDGEVFSVSAAGGRCEYRWIARGGRTRTEVILRPGCIWWCRRRARWARRSWRCAGPGREQVRSVNDTAAGTLTATPDEIDNQGSSAPPAPANRPPEHGQGRRAGPK